MPKNTLRSVLLIFICTFSLLLSKLTISAELNAFDVMRMVDERYTGETSTSTAVLRIIDRNQRERIRNLKLFNMERDEVEKSLIFFMSPVDVKGTAYMTYDWENESKEDDAWLYLPAMQKIKRVASSEESGKFMGSDFSYADINGLDLEDFNYEMLKKSEFVDGHDCWVIVSTPKNESVVRKTGYISITAWIRKDIHITVKSIINLKKANRIKYFAAKDITQTQGIWMAKTLQMVTTRNGKRENSSVLATSDVRYNESVDENMFDIQVMQRGI